MRAEIRVRAKGEGCGLGLGLGFQAQERACRCARGRRGGRVAPCACRGGGRPVGGTGRRTSRWRCDATARRGGRRPGRQPGRDVRRRMLRSDVRREAVVDTLLLVLRRRDEPHPSGVRRDRGGSARKAETRRVVSVLAISRTVRCFQASDGLFSHATCPDIPAVQDTA